MYYYLQKSCLYAIAEISKHEIKHGALHLKLYRLVKKKSTIVFQIQHNKDICIYNFFAFVELRILGDVVLLLLLFFQLYSVLIKGVRSIHDLQKV